MTKSVLADLLAGFVALVVILAGFITQLIGNDLRELALIAAALFFIAGFLRRNGFLVNLGSTVPVCIMAYTNFAFTSRPHLIIFIVTSLLAAVAGAYARRLPRPASIAIAAGWAVIAVVIAFIAVPATFELLSTKRVSYPAPRFAFTTIDGHQVTNATLAGRETVLAFWATWCDPCREELPRLDALRTKYSILAVNDERNGDVASAAQKAQAFFAKQKLSLPLVVSDTATSKRFGVTGLPALVVIDAAGNVRAIHTGYDAAENVERLLRPSS